MNFTRSSCRHIFTRDHARNRHPTNRQHSLGRMAGHCHWSDWRCSQHQGTNRCLAAFYRLLQLLCLLEYRRRPIRGIADEFGLYPHLYLWLDPLGQTSRARGRTSDPPHRAPPAQSRTALYSFRCDSLWQCPPFSDARRLLPLLRRLGHELSLYSAVDAQQEVH